MFTRIIVPLDGSALAEAALPYALGLADATGASLSLVSVLTPLHIVWDRDDIYDAATEAEKMTLSGGALGDLAARLRGPGRSVTARAIVGNPADEILRSIGRTGGDLIVMTTHGRGGIAYGAFGSVARKVLTAAMAPIVIVRPEGAPARPEEPAAIRRILVPLDGTRMAETAVPPARDVARALGARVTLARTLTLPPVALFPAPDAPTIPPYYGDNAIAGSREKATVYPTPAGAGPSAPAETLLDLLNEGGYDLVVMSTQGRMGLQRWAPESVAERLIESSHTPMLLLRSTDVAYAE